MKIPKVIFKTRIDDNEALGGACSIGGEWKNITTNDLFKKKKDRTIFIAWCFYPYVFFTTIARL